MRTLGGGLDPEEVDEIDDTPLLTRAERRALRRQDRTNWQTPNLAVLDRPTMSPIRRAGLLTLRGYLVVAVVFVVIKVVQAGVVARPRHCEPFGSRTILPLVCRFSSSSKASATRSSG